MSTNLAGTIGVVLFILTVILGLSSQSGIAFVCLALSLYFFWVSSNAKN
ncbi:hypothetical protein [Flavobacterium weaverense]|nr:hypothetical protein [Flavobacterium weaverense]